MPKHIRMLVSLVGATVLLSALVSTASANHLSSSTQNLRATWTAMEFLEPLGGIVRCSVTLEGSLHSATISKVAEALVGFITRSTLNSVCSGGHATILQGSLPWHVRYKGFEGILPDISGVQVNVIGSSFRVEAPFGNCLFTSTVAHPITGIYRLNTSTHAVTGVEVFGERIPSIDCSFVNGELRGRSATNSAQTITLI